MRGLYKAVTKDSEPNPSSLTICPPQRDYVSVSSSPTSLSPGMVWAPMGCHSTSFCCLPLETSSRPSAGPAPWKLPLLPVLVGHHHYGQKPTKWCSLWPACLLNNVTSVQQEQCITQVSRVCWYWVAEWRRDAELNAVTLAECSQGRRRAEAVSCEGNRDCKPKSWTLLIHL